MSDKASDSSPAEKRLESKNSGDESDRPKRERRSKRKIDSNEEDDRRKDRDRQRDRDDSKYSRSNDGRRSSRGRDRDRDRRRRRSRDRVRNRSGDRYSSRDENDKSYRKNDESAEYNEDVPLRRYWSSEKKNSDQYWNKYPTNKNEERIGQRFYGGRHEDKYNRSPDRGFEDKENKDDADGRASPSSNKRERITPAQKRTVDLLTSKTGGAYIPPAKLRMMQAEITDKSGAAYQRISWEALKKSIHGYINKVNTSNIGLITRELLHENIVRGRGLLARSIIQAQAASPTFTPIYGALTAVINSKVCCFSCSRIAGL